MNPARLPCGPDESDFQPDGPGLLASRSFWFGGAVSAGLWSLLLRIAVQA